MTRLIPWLLCVLLAVFIASITLAVHHGRQHAPGRHAEPDPEAERRSMAKLRGHVAARVADNASGGRPALTLPVTEQVWVPRPLKPAPTVAWTADRDITEQDAAALEARFLATAGRKPAIYLPPLKITACAVCGRQSHGTGGHDQWTALTLAAAMLRLPAAPAAEPGPADFRLPAWDPPPAGLPAYAEAALKHATVDAAVDSIFMRKVASDG
jgi:hypothetical protein